LIKNMEKEINEEIITMAEVVTMSLDMPLKPYLDYLAHVRCLSTHTIRSYRNDLEAWNYWLEEQEEEWQRADSICIRGFLPI
jgi:site-specific recombinase XerD